jgi:hypothetical protein
MLLCTCSITPQLIWASRPSRKYDICSGIKKLVRFEAPLLTSLFRLVYQNTLIETLIFFSLGVHLTVNTILISRRWKREKDPKAQKSLTLAQKMHRWSGYVTIKQVISYFNRSVVATFWRQ